MSEVHQLQYLDALFGFERPGASIEMRWQAPGQGMCPEFFPVAERRALGAVRLSLGRRTTEADVDRAIKRIEGRLLHQVGATVRT